MSTKNKNIESPRMDDMRVDRRVQKEWTVQGKTLSWTVHEDSNRGPATLFPAVEATKNRTLDSPRKRFTLENPRFSKVGASA